MTISIESIGKIRILEMIDRPSLGGGQRALLLIASHLDKKKFEVLVGSAGDGPLEEEARRLGLRHLRFPISKKITPGAITSMARLLRSEGISILHTHGGVAGLFGRLAGRKSKTPIIVHTLHGIHYLHYRNPLLRQAYVFQERKLSRWTDALILVCQADFEKAKKFRLAPVEKTFVIPNGLDPRPAPEERETAAKKASLGWPVDSPIVGTVARLHRQKGIRYLLEATPTILSAFPAARVVVVGEGPWGDRLRKMARRRHLEGRLLLLGEREDALELLSLFDIFVLPSLWEGLPFVLFEAAGLRKPIVATAVDGVIEVIEHGKTGLLVPPGDSRALAEAVMTLLKDRELAQRLAERARALIPPRFPLSRMIEQTQNLYLELCRRQL